MYNIFHVIVFSISLRNSIDSNLWFGGRQSTVAMVFTRWPREDSFPVSGALGGKCRRLNRVCNIMLQDLTPLHVKITRSTNLLRVCPRKFKLSTYLHTVRYNHISFLNTRSQVLWVLGTWILFNNMKNDKHNFIFENSLHSVETFFPCRCDIFRFFEFLLLGKSSTAPVFPYNQMNTKTTWKPLRKL